MLKVDENAEPLGAGYRFVCGFDAGGQIYCWGSNLFGQSSPTGGSTGGPRANPCVPTPVAHFGVPPLVSFEAGLTQSCGQDASSNVLCWGSNRFAGFGDGTFTPAESVPAAVPGAIGLSGITQLSVGVGGCALVGSTPSCWNGFNSGGEVGDGTFAQRFAPVAVSTVEGFALIVANDENSVAGQTCGLTLTGQAFCWGSNRAGELGTTATETCTVAAVLVFSCSSTPLPVDGGLTFTDLDIGFTTTCAVATDGAIYCWGANRVGQIGDGSTGRSQGSL